MHQTIQSLKEVGTLAGFIGVVALWFVVLSSAGPV